MKFMKKLHFDFGVSKRMSVISIYVFIVYLAFASVMSIWSIYIRSFLQSDSAAGLVVSFFSVLSFISLFLIVPFIEKYDKFKLCLLSSFLIACCYLFFFVNQDFFLFFLVACLIGFLSTIRISSSGILIEKNSKRNELSRNEGYIYSVFNFAFFIGPLIAFLVGYLFGYRFVFLYSAILVFIGFFVLKSSKINHGGRKRKIDYNPILNFLGFFKNSSRFKAYFLAAGVNFWWTLSYIYIPLYLIKSYSEYYIGIFLALIVIPLFLFEIYFSKKAEVFGYKKIFFMGYAFSGIVALLSFFIFSPFFIIPAIIFSSIFLAMLEPTNQAYFFDILKGKEDQRFFSPYTTSMSFGSFLGQIIPAVILIYFDFKYIFLVYASGMFFLAFLSLRIKDVIESRRKGVFR